MSDVKLHERDAPKYVVIDAHAGVHYRRCAGCGQNFATANPEINDTCGTCALKLSPEARANMDRHIQAVVDGYQKAKNAPPDEDQDQMVALLGKKRLERWTRKGVLFHNRRRWT